MLTKSKERQNGFSKYQIYSGTMGKVKKNFKRHMAELDRQLQMASPTLRSLRVDKTEIPQTQEGGAEENVYGTKPSPSQVKNQLYLDIQKAQDAFNNNKIVQQQKKELNNAIKKKK